MLSRSAAGINRPISGRNMDGIPRTKRLQGVDWLSQLPEDVLWTILGFLDLPTLSTARLICKSFRKSAAGCFKALDCATLEESSMTDFTQFSGTTYFAVTVSPESHLQSLAHPRIAPVITHVSLKGFRLRNSQTAKELEAVLLRLPKLRSVSLQPLGGNSPLPLFPARLEELKIPDSDDQSGCEQWDGVEDASPLTRYSQLTSLAIQLNLGAGPSMESLSSLCNLRSLDLCGCPSAVGVLSTFTALTSLTLKQNYLIGGGTLFQELGGLTGLSRLALLMLFSPEIVTQVHLACIAQLTNLTCLDMSGCKLANSMASSTALATLTRLVSVSFCTLKRMPTNSDDKSVRMPHLSLPQLETLQSLGLGNVADVSILGRATGLTHLDLSFEMQRWDLDSLQVLRPAVAGMSRLCSLEISIIACEPEDEDYYCYGPDDSPVFCLDGVLRACTMLTKLVYRYLELRPDRDLPACASLPGLRSLSFQYVEQLTPAWLPALQAMSGLTELSLLDTGIRVADMTPDVIAAFDAERRQLGRPRLKLRVKTWNNGCCEELE